MIVAERKPLEEIRESIIPYSKVLVLGCGGCVTVCLTGGEKQADILAAQLRMAAKAEGKSVTFDVACPTRQCDLEFIEHMEPSPRDYEAVLTLACGAGVGYMSDIFDPVPIIPAVNTTFLGANTEPGVWKENCHGCGDCMLAWTGGICPVARCSKSLVNGTCGGTHDGKCEVDDDLPCAWYLIYERLKARGRLDEYRRLRAPLHWGKNRGGGPRKLIHAEMLGDPEEQSE